MGIEDKAPDGDVLRHRPTTPDMRRTEKPSDWIARILAEAKQ